MKIERFLFSKPNIAPFTAASSNFIVLLESNLVIGLYNFTAAQANQNPNLTTYTTIPLSNISYAYDNI